MLTRLQLSWPDNMVPASAALKQRLQNYVVQVYQASSYADSIVGSH